MELVAYIQADDLQQFRNTLSELLKKEGEEEKLVSFSSGGASLLHWASDHNTTDFLNELLKSKIFKDVNLKDDGGATPLHWACDKGRPESVRLLLKNEAQVNIRDFGGETPLHWACLNGHRDCAELLLNYDAKIDVQADSGFTPLHSATINSHTDCITLLLNRGANRVLRDKQGRIPSDLAKKGSNIGDYFEDSKREILEKIARYDKDLKSLQEELNLTREANEDLKRRLAQTLKEQIATNNDLKTLEAQLKKTETEREQAIQEKAAVQKELEGVVQENEALKKTNSALSTRITELQKAQKIQSERGALDEPKSGFDNTHQAKLRMEQLQSLRVNLNMAVNSLTSTQQQLEFILEQEK